MIILLKCAVIYVLLLLKCAAILISTKYTVILLLLKCNVMIILLKSVVIQYTYITKRYCNTYITIMCFNLCTIILKCAV